MIFIPADLCYALRFLYAGVTKLFNKAEIRFMNIEKLPPIGWIGLGVIVALAFILLLRRGGKLSLFGQTIEVAEGGKVQKIDTIGLMYLMKDACEKIELLRKERAEDILPDISYLLTGISSLSCCMYRAESILNKRLYKNGFEDLTMQTVDGYIEQLNTELYSHLKREIIRAEKCAVQPPEPIDANKIYAVAKEFTRRAASIYLREVKSKADMYESYLPLFEKIGDKLRADFCKEKKEKKLKQAEQLREVLRKLNA